MIKLNGPINNYISFETNPPETKSSGPLERVKAVFEEGKASIIANFHTLSQRISEVLSSLTGTCGSPERIFRRENVRVEAKNRGKISDQPLYDSLRKSPAKLNNKALTMMKDMGVLGFKKEAYSPVRVDQGKCFAASALFIHDYLEEPNVDKIATRFENGVPIEGVITHEIYRSLLLGEPTDFELDVMLALRGYSPCELAKLTQEEKEVADVAREFIEKKYDTDHLIDYISHDYEIRHNGNSIPLKLLASVEGAIYQAKDLKKITDKDEKLEKRGLYARDNTIYRLNDMEIESTLLIDGGAEEAIGHLSNLKPGAYQLSLPCMNSFGSLEGFHAVAFIATESGENYLYDPNFAVGEMGLNPGETAERLIKLYTGYGSSPVERITNFFHGYSNPPSGGLDKGFTLRKIGKTHNYSLREQPKKLQQVELTRA